ncbi:MAG: hypothetical protein OZ921_19855, partial [Sorangiineae bacterium]|nr:hypothetical protein [Sorangiineae bacterium]
AENASAAAGGEFDKLAALKALAASGAAAARCRQGGAPPGAVAVVVTFGNDGRVASSRVNSGAYVGTPTARCILEKIDQTTVPAFGGAPRSLGTRVQLY